VTGRLLVFEEYEMPDGTVAKVKGELPPPPEELPEDAGGGEDDDDAALFPDDADEVEGDAAAQLAQ
jgi:hypothetical protein